MRLELGIWLAVQMYRKPSEQADHSEQIDQHMLMSVTEMQVAGVREAVQGQVVP
jgi:hypothetical protein